MPLSRKIRKIVNQIYKSQKRGKHNMNKIEANAQPLHMSGFMDEIVDLVEHNINTDVIPWLKEYLYLRKRELSCPSIQLSSRR